MAAHVLCHAIRIIVNMGAVLIDAVQIGCVYKSK